MAFSFGKTLGTNAPKTSTPQTSSSEKAPNISKTLKISWGDSSSLELVRTQDELVIRSFNERGELIVEIFGINEPLQEHIREFLK